MDKPRMSKFKESLKEEIKEEVGDLIYEKAKQEVKQEIKSRTGSAYSRFLAFFGIQRSRKKAIDELSGEIQQQDEIFMSETTLGILELFSLNFGRAAIEITAGVVGENDKRIELPDILKASIADDTEDDKLKDDNAQ